MPPLPRFAFALPCALFAALSTAAPPAPSESKSAPRWLADGAQITDTRSGLLWSAHDNGADIDWNRARAICAARGAGWRLPSVDELRSLHADGDTPVTCGSAHCRTAAPLKLSGAWFWSAAPVGKDAYDGDELAWGVSLASGASTQSVKEQSYGSRALCVRDAAAH